MTAPGMIASQINETNEMSGSKSFVNISMLHTMKVITIITSY